MKNNYKEHPVLNTLLSALIVGLDIVIGLIVLGLVIGLYELLN